MPAAPAILIVPLCGTPHLFTLHYYFLTSYKQVSPQKPCGSNYNLHETGRWVASLLLLCFQRPPPVKAVGGRPAIDSKSIRHPLNIMWV